MILLVLFLPILLIVILSLILVLLLVVLVIVLVVGILWGFINWLRNLLRRSKIFFTVREESWFFGRSLSCSNHRFGWESTVIELAISCLRFLFLFLGLSFLHHGVVTAATKWCWVYPFCKLSYAQFWRTFISFYWFLFGLSCSKLLSWSSSDWEFEIIFFTVWEEVFFSWSCFCCCDDWFRGKWWVVKVSTVLNLLFLILKRLS